jgi:hypothetical protein
MTEPLTIKDLNCGNCQNYTTGPHPIFSKDIHYCGTERISEYQRQCTQHKGCASHPLALQVLARSAIEKLESAIREDEQICAAIIDPEGKAFRRGEIKMAKEAIKLLKGDAP